MLRKKQAIAALLALGLLVTGCSPQGDSPAAESGAEKTGKGTEVLFWHSMSGVNQQRLMKIVDGFNSSQSDVKVVAEAQGNYDESTSKFFGMNGGSGSPAIIQIGEQNLQAIVDSDLVEPIDGLIRDYQYPVEDLVPQVVNFYTVDGQLYVMPFNASSPVLYYNVEALKKAGYEKAPVTFEGILEAAPKISGANPGMKGFSKPVYGYALDQMITNMGGLVVNHENGRASCATEVAYQDQALAIFNWLRDLVEADEFVNYGTDKDSVATGFYNGEIGMFITTSASAAGIMEGAPFEVGIAPLPYPEGTQPQGVYAGGGALCVSKGLDSDVRKGAMEFLAYATSPQVQAVWAGDTGYFAINSKSYDTETMKNIYAKTPQLEVAADQFRNSKQTPATAGPLLSQLPQLRNDLQAAEEMVFNGKDPKEALEQAVASTNKQIKTANKGMNIE